MKAVSLEFNVRVMLLIEKHHGSLVSGGRNPAYNELVGGHPQSRHKDWDAVDASFLSAFHRDEYFAACKRNGWHGYKKWTTRKRVAVYSCHIQRVRPRRSLA